MIKGLRKNIGPLFELCRFPRIQTAIATAIEFGICVTKRLTNFRAQIVRRPLLAIEHSS